MKNILLSFSVRNHKLIQFVTENPSVVYLIGFLGILLYGNP